MTITTRNGGAYYDDDATEPSAFDAVVDPVGVAEWRATGVWPALIDPQAWVS